MNHQKKFFGAHWMAFLLSATLFLSPTAQVEAMESRDIDVLIDAYTQAVSPTARQTSFAQAIDKIRAEHKAGNTEQAIEMANRLAATLSKDPELLSMTESQIGEFHVHLKKWPDAKRHFTNALRLEEGRSDSDVERFEWPLMWLAGVSIQLNALSDAEGHYLRLLKLKQDNHGPLHYRTIGQLWALANLSLRQNDLAAAEKYIQLELKIWATKPTFFGEPLGDASTALQNLGSVRAHQGKLDDAISLHLQARKLLAEPIEANEGKELGGGTLARAIECEDRLIALYAQKGNTKKVDMHRRAKDKFQKLLTHPPITISDAIWYQSLLPLP